MSVRKTNKERKKHALYMRRWRKEHKESLKESNQKYRQTHREIMRDLHTRWRMNNPEKRKEITRRSRQKHKLQTKAYQRQPLVRIARLMRGRVNKALKGLVKSQNTIKLVGCSIKKLKSHLEKQFKKGMNWKNYGTWHVDHIRPCASFDLSKPSEQLKCFNYKNLQPLWAKENLRKGRKCLKIGLKSCLSASIKMH